MLRPMQAVRATLAAMVFVLCPALVTAEANDAVRVDAGFPGGNILVQQVEGDTVFVAPDQRDTQAGQWWFYWNLRLRAPAEKPVTIVFTRKNPISVRGPAMSADGGVTWHWLGAAAVKSSKRDDKPAWSFEARVPAGAAEVRYAFCPPCLESHLRAWLAKHKANPALRVKELCRSRKGRPVELLRAGCLAPAKSKGVVLITSRHHCCEAMATYALEGWLDAALADDDTGRRWRANWEIIAVPFMDKDGVEDGDQGKNRAPHDHNRDYNGKPLYPEVAALMKLGASLKDRVVAALDLHCPTIRGEWNDRVYLVGAPQPDFWKKQEAFAAVLERVQRGPIRFRARDCLAFGTAWNTPANYKQGRSCTGWERETFPDARFVSTIEIAYADALGDEVNAGSARALGRDMARALAEFLESPPPLPPSHQQ
ncbi:MAG: hypothetical protein HZA91_07960 [Verrucomicrobia bacterium]|nr:hypothetical protein [Verrucomicrobiota bacterium]